MNQLPFSADEATAACGATQTTIPEFRIQCVHECSATNQSVEFSSPSKIAVFFRETVSRASWFDPYKECVVVIALDTKNRARGWTLVSLGTANQSLVHPREVLRPVIIAAASAFILIHNHPSGDPLASSADIGITRTLREAAKAVQITFVDHVIVGDPAVDLHRKGFFSFAAEGLL